jgi:hypothetical protein
MYLTLNKRKFYCKISKCDIFVPDTKTVGDSARAGQDPLSLTKVRWGHPALRKGLNQIHQQGENK